MEEKKIVQEEIEQKDKVLEPAEELQIEEEPYKVYGCDITTTNPLLKEFYQTTMTMTAIANLLVGEFDDRGNYVISKEIKRDIVVMDKEIEEASENLFKATSLYMKKNFYFLVKISQLEEGKAKAKLFLYEYVGDFLNKEFVVSHIANYIDVFDQDFVGKVRKAFNLVDVDKPNNDFDTPALAIKMQQMLNEQIRVQDLYDVSCEIFVLKMLKVLENYTQGKVIVEEFKALLSKYKGTLSFAKQKALLDKIINSMGGYDAVLKDNPIAQSLLKDFIKSYRDIMNAKEEKRIEDAKAPKEEKKAAPAGKSGGAKKGGAKKAGGGAKKGGAKKAGKKKSDKVKDDKKKSGGGVSEKERAAYRKAARAMYGLDKEEKPKEETPKNPDEKNKKPEENNNTKPENQQVTYNDEFEEVSISQNSDPNQGASINTTSQNVNPVVNDSSNTIASQERNVQTGGRDVQVAGNAGGQTTKAPDKRNSINQKVDELENMM